MSPYTLMTEAMRALGQVCALRQILGHLLRGEFHDSVLALYANAKGTALVSSQPGTSGPAVLVGARTGVLFPAASRTGIIPN